MMDADKKELMLFQERYLADGDLHSEGAGRVRRFRWRNIGKTLLARDKILQPSGELTRNTLHYFIFYKCSEAMEYVIIINCQQY